MKLCETCKTIEIDEKYRFCLLCSKNFKASQDRTQPAMPLGGQWHQDPVVDSLLKINANLGKMAQALEVIKLSVQK